MHATPNSRAIQDASALLSHPPQVLITPSPLSVQRILSLPLNVVCYIWYVLCDGLGEGVDPLVPLGRVLLIRTQAPHAALRLDAELELVVCKEGRGKGGRGVGYAGRTLWACILWGLGVRKPEWYCHRGSSVPNI